MKPFITMNEAAERIRLVKGGEAYGYPVASLRTEARKGNLALLRVAGKDYVTPGAIREMERLCRRCCGRLGD